jgi:hypothetical protein
MHIYLGKITTIADTDSTNSDGNGGYSGDELL